MGKTDVLVIGGGIAGVTAAIEAARAGGRVTLACAGPLFGGSSFYPGTWGLGLIGPEDETDEADLIATIERVGCGVADHTLVEAFVRGIRPVVEWLERDLGVELKRPASEASAQEAAFIPCFDHKSRLWRGITRDQFEAAAAREFEILGIEVRERCELMALAPGDDCAVLFDHMNHSFEVTRAGAVVLAAGGTGGLFARSLTSVDVLSSVHGIAMEAGCELVNIEFMQMMPGLVAPVAGLVFNEKTFRYAEFGDASGILPRDPRELQSLLEARSGHGPFTSRLGDEAVDLAIDATGTAGIPVRLALPDEDAPEFVQTFSAWLEGEHGISPSDELHVAMYAHAANGGIRIDADGWTGVEGIYACGEVTGGMHGADRIGGLSSANGLVFGRKAGRAAAHHALAPRRTEAERTFDILARVRRSAAPVSQADAHRLTMDLTRLMNEHCMINRTEEGLISALGGVEALQGELGYHRSRKGCVVAPDDALARGMRLGSQLRLAHAMATAMRTRRQSLGSHYRAD